MAQTLHNHSVTNTYTRKEFSSILNSYFGIAVQAIAKHWPRLKRSKPFANELAVLQPSFKRNSRVEGFSLALSLPYPSYHPSVKGILRTSWRMIPSASPSAWQRNSAEFMPCIEKQLCLSWHSRSEILFQEPPLYYLFMETCPYIASSCHQRLFWIGLYLVPVKKKYKSINKQAVDSEMWRTACAKRYPTQTGKAVTELSII